jgi:hypothetical protein
MGAQHNFIEMPMLAVLTKVPLGKKYLLTGGTFASNQCSPAIFGIWY